MTEFNIVYEVKIERECKVENDELYFQKPADLWRFLWGFIESMNGWYSDEEYTITIHKTKGEENGKG